MDRFNSPLLWRHNKGTSGVLHSSKQSITSPYKVWLKACAIASHANEASRTFLCGKFKFILCDFAFYVNYECNCNLFCVDFEFGSLVSYWVVCLSSTESHTLERNSVSLAFKTGAFPKRN